MRLLRAQAEAPHLLEDFVGRLCFGRHIATRFSTPIVERVHRVAARREERITEFIRAAVRLLVFDRLVAFLPGQIDTHRDAAVRQILAPLARHAEAAVLAIVAAIHLNKGQVQDVLYRVSGSIGFVGAARSRFAICAEVP